jgi:enoyl-CoA hydratase/carnithine racemase
VRATVERMEREGLPVPELAQNLLRFGRTRFYETADTGDTTVYVWLGAGQVAPYRPDPEFLTPTNMARHCPEVERNADASIYDLGDGVFCVGIHSKMNVLGPGVMEMFYKGAERAEREGVGLVVTGIGEHFSVGFNLQLFLMMIGTGDFDELLMGGKAFQDSLLRLRHAKVPVVAATFGYTLGGACELAMHCDRVVASAETYIGLPEVGVGIIPAGGGTSTMLYRALSSLPANADPYPAIRRIIETLGFGKVATSALEGVQYGFLRQGVDTISVNPDRILWLAKQEVQHLAAQGYTPPEEPKVMAYGNQVLTRMLIELHNLKRGNLITEHDFTVASQIAYVLAGGDLSQPAEMPLSYFYQLEIQVVGYLAQQPKTWERMRHMLETDPKSSRILGRSVLLLLFFLALLLLVALARLVPALLQVLGQRVADFLHHLLVDFLQASGALVGRERGVLRNLLADFVVALHDFADFLHLFGTKAHIGEAAQRRRLLLQQRFELLELLLVEDGADEAHILFTRLAQARDALLGGQRGVAAHLLAAVVVLLPQPVDAGALLFGQIQAGGKVRGREHIAARGLRLLRLRLHRGAWRALLILCSLRPQRRERCQSECRYQYAYLSHSGFLL